MEIFKLFGSILVDSDKADKSISKTGDKADGMGKKLGAGIKTAAKWGKSIGAAAIVAGVGMFALGVKLGNTADELLDLNSITGMSTDNIQKWRKAAEVAGVATDAMTNASTKFTKALDTMSVEGHKGQEALEAMGLSLSDIENMSADERMNVLTEALAGVDDKTERATLGADLFGGTWKEIAPIVDLGTEAMNKAKDSANIISEEDLVKANEFRIKVADMKEQLSFFVTEIAIAVMPTLQIMMDWVMEHMPQIKETMKTVFTVIKEVITTVWTFINEKLIPLFVFLYEWVQDKMPKIQSTTTTTFDKIREVADKVWSFFKNNILPILASLYDYIQSKMPQIKNIVETAFNAIKDVVNIVWNIFENLLLPILKLLWKFIEPTFPLIGTIIKTAFDIVIKVVEGVISVFETVTSVISTAVGWLTDWNDKDVKDKNTTVHTNYTSSGGGRMGGIPRYASGTDFHPGGMAIVGKSLPTLNRAKSVKSKLLLWISNTKYGIINTWDRVGVINLVDKELQTLLPILF